MVRQAKRYLAGAVGSAGLIAACVAVFVGLVALGASGNLPVLSAFGDEEPAAQRAAESTGEPARPAAAPSEDANPSGSSAPSTAASDANAGGDSTQPLTGAAGGGGDSPSGSAPQGGSDAPRSASTATRSPSRSSTPSPSTPQAAPPSQPDVELPGSQDVVDTVDDTVDQVDEALGGPLERSGVGGVVKDATKNAAGPDSAVGETVDGLTGALGG